MEATSRSTSNGRHGGPLGVPVLRRRGPAARPSASPAGCAAGTRRPCSSRRCSPASSLLAVLSIALGLLVTDVLLDAGGLGARRRERHHVARRRAHAVPHRRLGGRLDGRRRARAADPRRADRARLRVPAQVADRRVRRLRARRRVGDLPRHVAASSRATARTCTRLEDLPADASYPSGHTAASIAVYAGLVLLLTSRIRTRAAARSSPGRVAVADPALRRDRRACTAACTIRSTSPAALLVGIGAMLVLLFACRAAGVAARGAQRRSAATASRAPRRAQPVA